MNRINSNDAKNIYGGFAASTALAIGSCVFAGVSFVTNLVFGIMNVVNASLKDNTNNILQYSKDDVSEKIVKLL